MKTPKPVTPVVPAVVLALFAAGAVAARALDLPAQATLAALGLVLLLLRVGVMAAALEAPPGASDRRPAAREEGVREPALRAANG